MEPNRTPNRELVITLLSASASLGRRLDRSLSAIKGISFSEYQLLAALHVQHGMTATRVDLAAHVGLTPSGVTRALKPLEKLRFVKTTRDARDARRSLAKLTAGGCELVEDASGVVDDVVAGLTGLSSLEESAREQILSFLKEVPRA